MQSESRRALCAVLLLLTLFPAACARRRKVAAVPAAPGSSAPPITAPAPSERPAPSKRPAPTTPSGTRPSTAPPSGTPAAFTEEGLASWYGHPYHGRRAANGQVYDMEELTAAHRTLPFESWVAVRNMVNDKQVSVRITDRGPFVDGRVIDLSRAAARAIDLIGPGTAPVRLALIQRPPEAPVDYFAVQVGAFTDRARAEALRARLQRQYGVARIVQRDDDQPSLYRVLAGHEESLDRARLLSERLRVEYGLAFVVRLDD
jgi:rare lipoprotein A